MDLELARADRDLDAVALSTRRSERLGDGRLRRAEEPQDAMLAHRSACEHTTNGLGLESPRPEPLELARWTGQHDDDARAQVEYDTRRGSREAE